MPLEGFTHSRVWGCLCMVVLIALLSACQNTAYLEPEKRSGAVGKSRAEVIAEFGEPDQIYVEDEKEYLSYVFSQSVPYGYYNAALKTYFTVGTNNYYCRVTFLVIDDKVVQDYAVGSDCG